MGGGRKGGRPAVRQGSPPSEGWALRYFGPLQSSKERASAERPYLTREELQHWRSQIVTSNGDKMGLRYAPMAFTEQGVSMLSSVLKSERAIEVNIQIVRTFTKLRQMIYSHEDLKKKIEAMERKYDEHFRIVFEAIKQLLKEDEQQKKKIGFKVMDGM